MLAAWRPSSESPPFADPLALGADLAALTAFASLPIRFLILRRLVPLSVVMWYVYSTFLRHLGRSPLLNFALLQVTSQRIVDTILGAFQACAASQGDVSHLAVLLPTRCVRIRRFAERHLAPRLTSLAPAVQQPHFRHGRKG